MTKFSKKFCAKSPFKSGLIGLGRVIMSPRANTSRFTGDGDDDDFFKKSYSYSLSQAFKDARAGVDKKEILKKYKESRLKGSKNYV